MWCATGAFLSTIDSKQKLHARATMFKEQVKTYHAVKTTRVIVKLRFQLFELVVQARTKQTEIEQRNLNFPNAHENISPYFLPICYPRTEDKMSEINI